MEDYAGTMDRLAAVRFAMANIKDIDRLLCSRTYNAELTGVRIARMLEQGNVAFFQGEYLEYLFEMEKTGAGFRRTGHAEFPADLDYGLIRRVSQYVMGLPLEDRELIARRVNQHMVYPAHPDQCQARARAGDGECIQSTGAG